MSQRVRLVLGVCLAAVTSIPALAVERGTLLRSADLKARPFVDAQTVARLSERAPLEVVARQGPWMQVRSQGKQGYVRLLEVRLDVSDAALARAQASAAGSAVTRRSSSAPMATTGVRGFDEQALKDAKPAPAQFKAMVSYAVTAEQARQFAQRSPLTARQVPYYDEAGKPVRGGR